MGYFLSQYICTYVKFVLCIYPSQLLGTAFTINTAIFSCYFFAVCVHSYNESFNSVLADDDSVSPAEVGGNHAVDIDSIAQLEGYGHGEPACTQP